MNAQASSDLHDLNARPSCHSATASLRASREIRGIALISKWQFIAAICPVLAGTLGPLATGFCVCSVITGWRSISVQDQDGTQTIILKNPGWFVASNVVSIVSGFISNTTIFFLAWGKRSITVSIAGLLVQLSILVSLVAVTHSVAPSRKISEGYHFTQAYYYAVISFTLSAVTLICVASQGFLLLQTNHPLPSRVGGIEANLFRQAIAVIVYILLGAAIYAQIEDWAFLDAVFWADFTLLTIGLGGDLTPKTSLGRGLLLPYAIGGIVFIALLVVSVRKLLMDYRSRQTDRLADASRERLEQRVVASNESAASLGDEMIFNLVRRIPQDVRRRFSLMAFAFSITAAFTLLLGGAFVFHVAQRDPTWTYGESAYFAYVCLLTIGYGDFIPNSEASKPFFVVWSLLSVPVLTIFINNCIDAIYGSFRGLWPSFVRLMHHHQPHWMGIPRLRQTAQTSQNDLSRHQSIAGGVRVNMELQFRGANHFIESAFSRPDESLRLHEDITTGIYEADLRTRCLALAREVGVIVTDLIAEPEKRYSYQQWTYYLNLMQPAMPTQRPNEGVQRTEGSGSGSNSGADHWPRQSPVSSVQWASRGTPILLSNEAEWLLLRISSALTDSLQALGLQQNKEHV